MNKPEQSEQDTREQTAVMPPPFRPEHDDEAQEPTASPTLADRAMAIGLDEGTAEQLTRLTEGLETGHLSDELLATLAKGLAHDDDVQNADAAGYLRGRNEKIEAVVRTQPEPPDDATPTPVFPRYCRRSIWD